MAMELSLLAAQLLEQMTSTRYFLGITGPPGAGKSTLAEQLVRHLNDHAPQRFAEAIGIDGFHMTNLQLDAAGLRPVKGAPQTFEVGKLVDLLSRLRNTTRVVRAPHYSRWLHDPVPEAIRIEPSIRLLVLEGNYLLLPDGKWPAVRSLLDEVWYLDLAEDQCMQRVLQRHMRGGCTEEHARRKIEENDRPNYQRIAATRELAERVLSI